VKYAYYPGCSLESGSAAYDMSVRAVIERLGFGLDELDDWNCCGATEYFSQNELVATSVIARNLALVDNQHDQLVAPCAACFLNLKKTDKLMAENPEHEARSTRRWPPAGCATAGAGPRAAPAGRAVHGRRRGGDQGQGGPAA
jgi:heterodisulfide reductase subunit B2